MLPPGKISELKISSKYVCGRPHRGSLQRSPKPPSFVSGGRLAVQVGREEKEREGKGGKNGKRMGRGSVPHVLFTV